MRPNPSNERNDKMCVVCILTPGAIGSNPRVVKEADALCAAGFQVRVISTRILDRVDLRDEALMRRVEWGLQRIDLRSRNARRLIKLPQIAARRVFAATGHAIIAERAFSPYTAALTRVALRTPADLYIAHYPAALPAAATAARVNGASYAYDAEDFHLGDWPDDPQHETERRLVGAIEQRYLPGCAYVTAASPNIADAYAATYKISRPVVLLNVFPLEQAPTTPSAKGTADPGPSLYWFSQTIGPNRGLECATAAIARAQSSPHLYLRGHIAEGFEQSLRELAERLGIVKRVHFLPPAAPDEMERLAAKFDAGLCGEPGHTANNRRALSNKLFSFLLAGVPPLMSSTPAHSAFAKEAGLQDCIYPIDDEKELASLLDKLFACPKTLATARANAWHLSRKRYNWQFERSSLVNLVAASIDHAAPTNAILCEA